MYFEVTANATFTAQRDGVLKLPQAWMKDEGDEQKESTGITLFTGTRALSARVIVPLGLSAASTRVTAEGFRPKTLMNFSYFAPSLVSGSCRVTCWLSPCEEQEYMGGVTVCWWSAAPGVAAAHKKLRRRLLRGRHLHVRLSVLQLVFGKTRGAPGTPPPPTACCTFTEVQQVFFHHNKRHRWMDGDQTIKI